MTKEIFNDIKEVRRGNTLILTDLLKKIGADDFAMYYNNSGE